MAGRGLCSRLCARLNGKLGGKKLILSFTTGAPQALYTADGFFGHSIEEYLIPFETTARLCNLELLAPVYTCGVSYADRDAEKIARQKTLAREHASRLVDLLNAVSEKPRGRKRSP
jgi:Putative NADPH-quinone reductase (modulator of drug activity B)